MLKVKLLAILVVLDCTAVLLTGCPARTAESTGSTDPGTQTSVVFHDSGSTAKTSDTTSCTAEETGDIYGSTAVKPVIYLYPAVTTQVDVSLDYIGRLTCTYPDYDGGWHVTADPDGTLTNMADGREYSYLYWEGAADTKYDFSRGFVIKGEDTAAFLQEKLAGLGLAPKEYNEFIVYWLPRMLENPYNLITFQDEEYTDTAVLSITPEPDSILRVFMVYKPLDQYEEIEEQILPGFERKGFTVVEWGGSCVEQ